MENSLLERNGSPEKVLQGRIVTSPGTYFVFLRKTEKQHIARYDVVPYPGMTYSPY